MTVYRIVSENGYKEAEFPDYATAKRWANMLHQERNPAHFRVEQVDTVYNTANDQ